MEAGLAKLLQVTRVSADEAELGWKNALTRWVATQQHNGATERRTAAQMKRWNTVAPGIACTDKQAKRLRLLGFRIRQKGKKTLTRPSVAWIQQHVNYAKAGLLIRILNDENPRHQARKAGTSPCHRVSSSAWGAATKPAN